jgi:type III secretion protein L
MAIGKVIKGDSAGEPLANSDRPVLRPPPRAGVMNAEVFDARQTAQGIIEEAYKEKERILAEAQKEREDVLAKARDQGKQEGMAHATELVLRAKMQAGDILARQERDVVALACKIAEKIISRDIERDPTLLVDICAKAVEELRSARAVVLRVNPKSAAVLRARKAELMELIGRAVDVAIREDADVAPVGCIVQTEFGTVDAQLPTQFEMLQNVLFPEQGKKEGPP